MTGTAEPVVRPGRRGGIALGVTVVVVAVVATPLLLRGGGRSSPAASSPPARVSASAVGTAPPSASAAASPGAALLADGETVEASGRVVSVPGKPVRLCAPVPTPAIGYAAGDEPAPAWCPLGIDVTGVDLGALLGSRTKDGATEGYAYVRGVYRSGKVAVSVQTAERSSLPTYPGLSDMTKPPCPVPAAGWHRETPFTNPAMGDTVSAYGQSHPGQVEAAAIYRPNDTTGVVVAAVKDLAAARAALPDAPGSLCLLASKYTAAQVTAAQAPFDADQTANATSAAGQVVIVGLGVGTDWQSLVEVQVVAMTADVVMWAAAAPDGLVSLVPWLTVVGPTAPLPPLETTGPPSESAASAALLASEDAAYPSAAPSSRG